MTELLTNGKGLLRFVFREITNPLRLLLPVQHAEIFGYHPLPVSVACAGRMQRLGPGDRSPTSPTPCSSSPARGRCLSPPPPSSEEEEEERTTRKTRRATRTNRPALRLPHPRPRHCPRPPRPPLAAMAASMATLRRSGLPPSPPRTPRSSRACCPAGAHSRLAWTGPTSRPCRMP